MIININTPHPSHSFVYPLEKMETSLFPELTKHLALAEDLKTKCQTVAFNQGDILLSEGGYAAYIPLVLEGLVKVYKEDEDGNEVLLYYINPGESCIMSATYCMQNQKSEVKAVVEQASSLILVPAQEALAFGRQYPGWNEFLFNLFQSKYSELLQIIQTLTFAKKDKRLLGYLQNEQKVKGSDTLHITHQQIAHDIGSTREVVSRLLKKLEHEGYLTLEHKKIILKD